MPIKEFKMIEVRGSHYDMGYEYGKQAGSNINGFVESTFQMAKIMNPLLTFSDVASGIKRFVPFMEKYAPDIVEELRGMADGSGIPLEKIFFLQIRGEMAYPKAETCTSFAISTSRSADGNILIGQNIDWIAQPEHQVIVHLIPKEGPRILAWSWAGTLGQAGINSEGMARVGNGLTSSRTREGGGFPTQFLMRCILNQPSVDEAIKWIRKVERSKSGNHVLADRSGKIVDIETTALEDRLIEPENGFVAHSNNYQHPDFLPYERGLTIFPDSPKRSERLKELVSKEERAITVDMAKGWLRDHINYPVGLCRHKSEGPYKAITTIASVIAQPSQGLLHVCAGNPCEGEYTTYKV